MSDLIYLFPIRLFNDLNIIGVVSQLVVNTIVGQSSSALWGMINTLQLINYLAMMSLYYPRIILALFSYIGIANMENELLSQTYLLHIDESKLEGRDSWDYRFKNQGIESTNILLNSADLFMTIIMLCIYYLLIFLLWLLLERRRIE